MSFDIDNFETIYGTKKSLQALRNKVLDLAIRGKLVEQDATDEPAREIVKAIKVNRDKLIKEEKIKAQKKLPDIKAEDIPFEIPSSWEWVRLGQVTTYGVNETIAPEMIDDESWVLELEDIEKESGVILQKINNKMRKAKSNKNKFYKGNVLYGKLRPYLKKILVASEDGVCTTEIIAFEGECGILSQYLVSFLKSSYTDSYVNEITHGMNMPRLGTDNAREVMLPLPPIAEQKRIVNRIEVLSREIDKLEDALNRKEQIGGMIPKAFTDTISKCESGHQIREQLKLLITNFKIIFETPESMQELRNVILQLAIEGKLVQQLDTDESALQLLEEIKAKYKNDSGEGKSKRQYGSVIIPDEEIPFEIPQNWIWVRLGYLGESQIGLTYSPSNIVDKGLPVLRSNNINNAKINYDDLVCVNVSVKEELIVKLNDILICSRNGSKKLVGKSALIDNIGNGKMTYGAFMTILRSEFYAYIFLLLNSRYFRSQLDDSNTMTVNQLTQSMLLNILVPLPPFEEQQHIVNKVSSIMGLIDEMENKLDSKRLIVERMSNTEVH